MLSVMSPLSRIDRRGLARVTWLPVLALIASLVAGLGQAASASEPGVGGCDPLDEANCLLPFPNDAFTVADATTDTGRRVAFDPSMMPISQLTGRPIDPTAWNASDGFSVGSPVLARVPGLDLHQTWGTADQPFSDVGPNEPGYFDHRDHIADIGRYEDPDAPIVILDAITGQRHPFWSELDQSKGEVDDPLLILRPAVNFAEGHRYIVALRDLEDGDGDTIAPGSEFTAYRDGTASGERADHFEGLFDTLASAGIARDDLYLAWDFTVASQRSTTGAALHIRDDAFAQLGDADLADRRVDGEAPQFTIDHVEDLDPPSNGAARLIEGTVTVPNYLDMPGGPTTSVFNDPDGDGLPDQLGGNGTLQAQFRCHLPESAASGGAPATPLLYGHGLLGSTRELNGESGREMRLQGFATCATLWIGMSEEDIVTVITLMTDLGGGDVNGAVMDSIGLPDLGTIPGFETVAERSQQGFLNFMYVGRAMVHPDGFASHPAFQVQRGEGNGAATPAIRTARRNQASPLVYDGNSQGAIMGGAYMALTPDAQRGVLGVPGMNYSTLLNRSVDWEGEAALSGLLYTAYPGPVDQQVIFGLLQMLWDRAEANGYAHHMTDDPLPNTPSHDILLHTAFGDHQVANVSAEVEARTIGAPLMVPALEPGLHWEQAPYFVDTATYPHRGSAMVYWDSGNATPPNGNIPATHDGDPHEDPRREPAGAYQKARFLTQGIVVDVCDGQPYRTDDHPAAGGEPLCTDYPEGSRQ